VFQKCEFGLSVALLDEVFEEFLSLLVVLEFVVVKRHFEPLRGVF
jgi:hypothetical protein